MKYILVCEIGPIVDFVSDSRKTVDYWAGSFLFSYLIKQVANKIKSAGAEILLPDLAQNSMFTGAGTVDAGSIPDQIYFIIKEENKEKIEKELNDLVPVELSRVADKIALWLQTRQGVMLIAPINKDDITRYFNFFYIFHPIDKEPIEYEDYVAAREIITMRSLLRKFDKPDHNTDGLKKWEKCSLCGNRQGIVTIKVDKEAGFYNDEHICSVCLYKRYFSEVIKDIQQNIVKRPKYDSTSDFALAPIKKCIEEGNGDVTKAFGDLMKECKAQKKEDDAIDSSEGRYFFDSNCKSNLHQRYRDFKKLLSESTLDHSWDKWFDRPFYSIVYMDGDDLGKIFGQLNDLEKVKEISRRLTLYSSQVSEIIRRFDGQLIFAGGEDVNFIVHPEYLLECIKELTGSYKRLFSNFYQPEKFTVSTGTVICYHKYPLKQAIGLARETLEEHAKKYARNDKKKDAFAITLIKGHTINAQFACPNGLMDNFLEIRKSFTIGRLSKSFPYKLEEDKKLLFNDVPVDDGFKSNYLRHLLGKTRGKEEYDGVIETTLGSLVKLTDFPGESMIDALLVARFLAGEKES